MSAAASGSGMFKFLKPSRRPQSTDIQAAAGWGVAAFSAAIFLVQICPFRNIEFCYPFDWIKKTFIEKPQPEEN
ncbi:hypothetical protein Leryth_009749 [Lithospermum erythrorhizon]|nr:hypothetical protein Leryth_009749 [Lithospermum erythrorhizon]